VIETAAQRVEHAAAFLHAVEGAQDRRDVLGRQLAPLRQQDQFGRRFALAADAVGQGDERLHRGRNLGERGDQIALGGLDALADGDFFMRLQQLPPSDVLQVDTDQVHVFAADPRLERLFLLLVVEIALLFDVLRRKGLRLLVFEQPLRVDVVRLRAVHVLVVLHVEAELLRAVVPVEHLSLARGVVPLDQRLPPGSGFEGQRFWPRGCLRHGISFLQGCCLSGFVVW
jgi:hypothetical protein